MSSARPRLSSVASTAMVAAVASTTFVGATAVVVQYRIFQGPGTGQLLLMWIFTWPWTTIL